MLPPPPHCTGVQGGKHRPSAVVLLWLFVSSKLVSRQNLSLERVEGRFPREMGQGGEMTGLISEPVKNHMAGSFQGSGGN